MSELRTFLRKKPGILIKIPGFFLKKVRSSDMIDTPFPYLQIETAIQPYSRQL